MKNVTASAKIYLVITQTTTRFGKVLRKVEHMNYNHASISFDRELTEMYSFGRFQHRVPIVAGLLKETAERFSSINGTVARARIYEITVTQEQRDKLKALVLDVINDKEYIYNLLSVFLYPLKLSYYTYKALSCVEFTVGALFLIGVKFDTEMPTHRYLPEDIPKHVDCELVYDGNILDVIGAPVNIGYFDKVPFITAFGSSAKTIWMLLKRKKSYKTNFFLKST